MRQGLRLLVVDDSEDDAILLIRELRKGGMLPNYTRVDNEHDMRKMLSAQQWDIIITDHNMPGFSSEEALAVVREAELDVPVIIVSGTIGEDVAVRAMKAGAHDYIMKDNLARLLPAIQRELKEATVRDARKRAERTLHHMAYHDSLTDLVNRREFERRLKSALNSSKERGLTHMLLYLDLDQFKIINDTCGHVAGDELLKQLAILLSKHIRESDTLARLGGDEFGILLESCAERRAIQLAQELNSEVRNFRFVWQQKPFTISLSIGIVAVTSEYGSGAEILSHADIACYAAKDKGRNTIQVYQSDDVEMMRRRTEMQWISRIRIALEENRFFLYQQPMERIGPDRGAGLHTEFLLRLREGDEVIPPGAFIPAAERYSLMPLIDRRVIELVFQYLAESGKGMADKGAYFINLSGASLSDDKVFEDIRKNLRKYKIRPERICFEITETAAIAHLAETVEFIREIREEGFKFALDDFGCGMSSFSYLKTIPVDYLKIDGSFVRNMLSDPIDVGIVEACNRIGHAAGLTTIAEFVENEQIKEKLIEIGVDYAQGFAVSKPKPL
ncbi:predicted signal transduction protein containing a membrane domain, an EAL and a GGDEF domain [Hahella chejuensis KCTC 2396]|uniref:Predicted signal transduction protein containing a membrane domain, an EAL and a GGDEF domain n=1 Tax=Hahella chejuensis (strain KCTC 2396) TaxID=349521 RepID=Q2SJ14_HAHCH|nr:GGDEF domain-containing response regulator [Hahella chejuensis]ABC29360.1 predicted signal transduction protein containing a membrane domain, an EAL and a GGDEF domain [Hahella chejuensis KCTC 2396]